MNTKYIRSANQLPAANPVKKCTIMKTTLLRIFMLAAFSAVLSFGPGQSAMAQTQGPGASWASYRVVSLSPATPVANFQVKVTLTTGQYGGMQTDGRDLRFYDNNNINCEYSIEGTFNTAGTTYIWVKVPSSGATALVMYYGNAGASAASNGANVFEFFDDFTTALGANWSTAVSGTGAAVTQSGTNVTVSQGSTNGGSAYLSSAFTPASAGFYVEAKFRAGAFNRNRFYATTTLSGPNPVGGDNGYFSSGAGAQTTANIYWNPTFQTPLVNNTTDYISQWQVTDGAGANNYNWSTLSYLAPQTVLRTNAATFNSSPNPIRYVTFGVTEAANTSTIIDWVRVRKHNASQPVATVNGATANNPVSGTPIITVGSGFFVVPTNVYTLSVEAWGGGGAGGGVNSSTNATRAGGGGSGGNYTKNASVAVTPGQIIPYTVGAGGTGVSTGDGLDGLSSTFSSGVPVTATGGDGGKVGITAGTSGAGGNANSGNTQNGGKGANGGASAASSGGGGGGAGSTGPGGAAGSSGSGPTAGTGGTGGGGNGAAGLNGTTGDGLDAPGLSGGGSGARSTNNTDRTGGDGFRGQLIVSFVPLPSTTTTTTITPSASIVYGTSSITFTATVSPNPASGTVQFQVNGVNVGAPQTVSGAGTASLTTYDPGTLTVGSYTVRGNYSGNASFAPSTGTNTTLTVTKKPITVSGITVTTKTYNANNSATFGTGSASFGGVINGDVVNVASVTGTFNSVNAGGSVPVTVTAVTLGGAGAGNYDVSPLPSLTGTISQKALTANSTVTKIYDATVNPGSVTLGTVTGLVGAETLNITPTAGNYTNANVGTLKPVTISYALADGTGLAANYSMANLSGNVGAITARPLTITANSNSKGYDGNTSSATGPSITAGVVQGSDVANFTQVYTTKHAGTGKTLVPSGSVSDGNGGNNYTYNFVNNNTGVITQEALTITAVSNTKIYNATTAAAGIPTVTGGAIMPGDAGNFTETYDTRHAGTGKILTPTGIVTDGNSGNNYTYNYVTDNTGVIDPRPITVTAVTNTKTYDANTSAAAIPTVTPGAVQPGDVANFTETYDTKDAGAGKTLTPAGTVTDGNSGNNYAYTFVVNNTGVINAATLLYVANPATRLYGAPEPAFSGTVTGFIAPETELTETTGTLVFNTTATITSNVGSYPINGSGLTSNTANYTFAQAAANATRLTITAAPLTITANNQVKCSGITFTFNGTEFTTSGLLNSDAVTSVTLTSAGAPSGATAAGSPYSIVPSAAVGTGLGNYSITYTNGVFTVNQSQLVDAGPALNTICRGGVSVPLGGSIGGSATSGTWSDGGVGGTFTPNANDVNATWTPPASYVGTATLTLLTSGGPLCGPVSAFKTQAVTDACQVITLTQPIQVTVSASSTDVTCTNEADGTISVTGLSAGATYIIQLNGTGPDLSGQTVFGPGTYLITASAPDGNNAGVCTETASVTIHSITANAGIDQTICEGSTVTLTGIVDGTGATSTWTSSSSGTLGFDNPNSPSAIYTPNAADILAGTVTLTLTNERAGCPPIADALDVTINPTPTVDDPADDVVCNGAPTAAVNFTGAVPGTTYNWTNNNTSIGLAASGNTDIASFTAINTGNTAVTATIIVTPVANGCTGLAESFTITVNPTPTVVDPADDVVCNGAPTAAVTFTGAVAGTTYNWTNDNTSIGLVAGGSGNIPSFNAINTGNSPEVATITVTTVANGCPGGSQTFTITVNPTPTVDDPSDDVVCNGAPTAAVTFTGAVAGTTYDWTNDNPGIGLAASGSGPITSFIAINAGNTVQVATITVTPTANNCPGASQTFTITVNPTPTVDDPSDDIVCNGAPTAAVTFTGAVAGTTYDWTNDNPGIGLAASGSGPIASFTAINAGNTVQVATVTVTPTANSCPGASQSFTITVNPTPTVDDPSDDVVCNGAPTAAVTFTGAVAGTTYDWTNDNPGIGLAASGSGPIASFTAINAGNTVQVATITVTPTANSCPGASQSFTITVNPTPTVDDPADDVVCNGAPTAAVTFTGAVAGTTYNWTNDNTSIGLAASGNTDIASFNGINTGTTPQVATITVTPVANGCPGTPQTFTITVNPTPTVDDPADDVVCDGAPTAAVTFTGAVAGTVYNWTNDNASIGLAAAGSGNIASFTATNTGNTPQVATITVTPTVNGCSGTPQTFTITVNPSAKAGIVSGLSPVCLNASTQYIVTGADAGGTWSSTNPSVASVSPSGLVTGLSAGTSDIRYTVTTGCNSPVFSFQTVAVVGTLVTPGPLTGFKNVCPYVGNNTQLTYSVPAVPGATYAWIIPPFTTLISGQGTNSIVITIQNGFNASANKQLRVTAQSPCGNSPQAVFFLLTQLPTTPLPIVASSTNLCPVIGTATPITYKIPKVLAASSYLWTVTPTANITVVHPETGENDTLINITYNAGFNTTNTTITVKASNDCGTSTARSYVVVKNNPTQPGLISGPNNACPHIEPGAVATYSIGAVTGATTYTWNIPVGATNVTGLGTNSVSFNFPPTFTSGTISVTYSNGCGTSPVRTFSVAKQNAATPGPVDVIPLTSCPTRSYSYTINQPAHATSVQWTWPAAATYISGQGTNSLTLSYPVTAVNGNITAQSSNNCSQSALRTLVVKLPACPPEEDPRPILFSKGGSKPAVEKMSVNVSPNPTVSDFKLQVITAGKELISVRVLDMQGRALKTFTVSPYTTIRFGNELKAGTYLIEILQGEQKTTKQLLKF